MIRSNIWRANGTDSVTATLLNVPDGKYEVFLYTWEDNAPTTFSIYLEGQLKVPNHNSGSAGTWTKHSLGQVFVLDGNIKIKAVGGDACLSGVEVRKFKPHRAINLAGPALTIDENTWEASATATGFTFSGRTFENQTVPLNPATDAARATMIRSNIWRPATTDSVTLTLNVPASTYRVFLYTWEDNASSTFDLYVEGKNVKRVVSGTAGTWLKHDFGNISITDGNIKIKAKGGDACLSGLEVWNAVRTSSSPSSASRMHTSTAEVQPEEITDDKASVYPVPFTNELTIGLTKPERKSGALQTVICDISGTVKCTRIHEVNEGQSSLHFNNLESLHQGIYILTIRTSETTRRIKISKK